MKTLTTSRLAMAALALAPLAARAYDYPTIDRVTYVQECMRANAGPFFEMTNKCVCVIDALAKDIPYDDFVSMETVTNATSIGGERGSYIRDTESLQVQIKKFRELQNKAKAGCFIKVDPK